MIDFLNYRAKRADKERHGFRSMRLPNQPTRPTALAARIVYLRMSGLPWPDL